MEHLPAPTTRRRFAHSPPTTLISLVLAGFLLAATVTTSAAAAEGDDIPFEERDGISASAIEFSGVANSANARWLVSLYADVFARPADLGGLDHWLARIAAGGERSRLVVARSFLSSQEGSRNEAVIAYQELLGRSPDPQGLVFWTDYLRTGSVNSLRFQHLASPEYYRNAGGTNDGYVRQLYRDLLGREIDSSGLRFYVGRLDTGTPTWWVSRSIYESNESLGNRVTAYYTDILGRSPTAKEMTQGVQLIFGGDERAVQAVLLASDEAFDEFLLAALDS